MGEIRIVEGMTIQSGKRIFQRPGPTRPFTSTVMSLTEKLISSTSSTHVIQTYELPPTANRQVPAELLEK